MFDAIPWYLFPFVICAARICDVSIGTIRTVAVVRGRVLHASVLGFFEVGIWVLAISGVMSRLDNPLNVLGYALGFALGNATGIAIERRLALGNVALRIITRTRPADMAAALRERGLRVTEFDGQGRDGPVSLLYTMMDRADAGAASEIAEGIDPDCFIVLDDPRGANRSMVPTLAEPSGWRSVLKRK
jgi:uncharacterized protein YebE (UPF0316 family)